MKGIIPYLKNNGVPILKEHVDVDHVTLAKKFEEKLNNFGRAIITKQPTKKRPNIFTISVSIFLGPQTLSKKMNLNKKNKKLKDFALLIIKNHLLMQIVKSVWLKDL
jgi:hypothetical protein